MDSVSTDDYIKLNKLFIDKETSQKSLKNVPKWEGYVQQKKKCVNGANIAPGVIPGKTVAECSALCDANRNCKAFEYGTDYGGQGRYKTGDCQLQSSADSTGCNGAYHNLDLYVPKEQFKVEGLCNGRVEAPSGPVGTDCNTAFSQVIAEQGYQKAKEWCDGDSNKGCSFNQGMHDSLIRENDDNVSNINNENSYLQQNITDTTQIDMKNTDLEKAIINEQVKTDNIINKQIKEQDFNKDKLGNVSEDIDTIERQVQISENETLKKNNLIFQLKIIFIFLLLSVIPTFLMKNNKLTQPQGIGVLGVMGLILLFILFKNFLNHRYNNVNDINVQNWIKPDIEAVVRLKTEGINRANAIQERLNNMSPLEKYEFLLTEKKNYAVQNKDYAIAGYFDDKLKRITAAIAAGDIYGGLGNSDEDVASAIESLNDEEENKKLERMNQIQRELESIRQKISIQESTINSKITEQQQNRSSNSELETQINTLRKKLKFENEQLLSIQERNNRLQTGNNTELNEDERLQQLVNFRGIGSV